MEYLNLRFDDDLAYLRGPTLKQMSRLWSQNYSLGKEDCIEVIKGALKESERVRCTVAALKPHEKAALAIVKQAGGVVDTGQLTIALKASGVPMPDTGATYYEGGTDAELIRLLFGRCIIMGVRGDYLRRGFSDFEAKGLVYADSRMLAHAGPVKCKPLQIEPVGPPQSSAYRRPPTVVFDIFHALRAVKDLGGLELKRTGEIRVSEVRKFVKAIGWKQAEPDGYLEVDSMRLPHASAALTGALLQSRLLAVVYDTLVVQCSLDQLPGLPYHELVGPLFSGFIQNASWREWDGAQVYDYDGRKHVQARQALAMVLTALPADSDGFFSVDDIDRALFERVGEFFSLSSVPYRPGRYGRPGDGDTPDILRWRKSLRTGWLQKERIWITHALTTWLYYLGMVELGINDGDVGSVRLTDLGRAVLHPQLAPPARDDGGARPAPWVVQPNFDIVVYLDRVEAAQLAFLGRVAQRVQVSQHVAHYRLVRETVYLGLEGGLSSEDLVGKLKAGAGADLPQNVLADLREWCSMHGRISLHRSVRLLEFTDDRERQAAFEAGLKGLAVGDRFVRIAPEIPAAQWTQRKVDYSVPLLQCLTVAEDGLIRMKKNPPDLLIRAQLDKWAERVSDDEWRLTRTSVSGAPGAKAHISQLLQALNQRLDGSLPPLLEFALGAWAGERLPVSVATVTVLHSSKPAILRAITTSERFRACLLGQLSPDTVLVDSQQLGSLREHLAWAGLRVSEGIHVEETPPQTTHSSAIRKRGRPRKA